MSKNNKHETFGIGYFNSIEEAQELASQYGMTVKDNCFVLGTKTDKEKLLNQVGYWVANDNLVKARLIMKSLGFPHKMIRAYINDEQGMQKRHPKTSGYDLYKDKPMPKHFIVRGN